MSRHRTKRCIQILDALPGEKRYTSPRAAARYVDEERADWANRDKTAIRFRPDNPRHLSTLRSIAIIDSRTPGDAGMATLAQVAGLPVVQPVKLLTDTSKSHRAPKGRSGPVISRTAA